jgi:hypothetical protein
MGQVKNEEMEVKTREKPKNAFVGEEHQQRRE